MVPTKKCNFYSGKKDKFGFPELRGYHIRNLGAIPYGDEDIILRKKANVSIKKSTGCSFITFFLEINNGKKYIFCGNAP